MRARKVYEALGDVFKPKDIEEIKPHLGLEDHEELFQNIVVALAEKGYIVEKLGGSASKDDYQNNVYSFQGKKIVAGDATWVKLKAAQELKDMDIFWNDSMYDEDPNVDSMMHFMQLEDGTYVLNLSVNLRGTWHSRKDDDDDVNHFYGMEYTDDANKLVPLSLKLAKEAESFLENEIDGLKVYGENW